MAGVTIRFDARELKRDLQEMLDFKVRSVTTNPEVYNQLLWAYAEALQDVLPVDTGALAYGSTGISKYDTLREGDIHTTSKGLVYDPVEYYVRKRNSGGGFAGDVVERHYGCVAKRYSDKVAEREDEGTWEYFVEKAQEILVEGMNNAK